jgi:hypothetical protein
MSRPAISVNPALQLTSTGPGALMRAVAAKIQVDATRPGEFRVTVSEGKSQSVHTVSVEAAYARKLGGDAVDAAALVRRSFEFLLEREPKESILTTFALPVIGRYFPEYERDVTRRLAD